MTTISTYNCTCLAIQYLHACSHTIATYRGVAAFHEFQEINQVYKII